MEVPAWWRTNSGNDSLAVPFWFARCCVELQEFIHGSGDGRRRDLWPRRKKEGSAIKLRVVQCDHDAHSRRGLYAQGEPGRPSAARLVARVRSSYSFMASRTKMTQLNKLKARTVIRREFSETRTKFRFLNKRFQSLGTGTLTK